MAKQTTVMVQATLQRTNPDGSTVTLVSWIDKRPDVRPGVDVTLKETKERWTVIGLGGVERLYSELQDHEDGRKFFEHKVAMKDDRSKGGK